MTDQVPAKSGRKANQTSFKPGYDPRRWLSGRGKKSPEQREGEQIRIHVQLIRVEDQTEVWAEPYQREISGILAIQREVARGVAGQLALQLLPAEEAQLADVRAVNPEAYAAYLKEILRYYRLTPQDLDVAFKYFELALEKDPKFALA